ncbi:hypothetical protein NE850_18985 [Paraburkholderia sp. USG1]|uniref:hypothetical protein n=1 Tax=Paraburkholderia sp. USG1 TaxID=2952268 RepID=UPI002865C424|nr:hypothetical protein [Paraburkholderia sp. USG1]MDR8398429.1 hypothetical protein [Paraburkholderia sp. USG1]
MTDRASPLDRRSKAFKGKGEPLAVLAVSQVTGRNAFRVLLRSYEGWHAETVDGMEGLARETTATGLDATLRCVRITLPSGAVRRRLDWFLRGEPHAVTFSRVQACFSRLPAPLHDYLRQCHARAKELNALESVFRYAASQIAMYLDHGTVKVKRPDT